MKSALSEEFGNTHHSLLSDLETINERKILIDEITKISAGKLDVLVNNAAFTGDTIKKLTEHNPNTKNEAAWARIMEINLTACFELSHSLATTLSNSEDGNILNVGSIYGFMAPDYSLYKGTNMSNPAAYGASKAGLSQITKWLAATFAPDVRVNILSPGGVYRNQPEFFVNRYSQKTLLGRMANEDDIVAPMVFLTSAKAKYITGHNLVVDGGYSIC